MSDTYVAFDFDGVLVTYDKVYEPTEFGEPVWPMIELAKKFLAEGTEVRILTARAATTDTDEKGIQAQISFSAARGEVLTYEEAVERIKYWNDSKEKSIAAIKAWCKEYLGQELVVTCTKDFRLEVLYDDRARHVEFNKGTVCCEH